MSAGGRIAVLVARIDDLEAMCASYADTIGKCNAENNDLEANLAAVTRERDEARTGLAMAKLALTQSERQRESMTRERDAQKRAIDAVRALHSHHRNAEDGDGAIFCDCCDEDAQ